MPLAAGTLRGEHVVHGIITFREAHLSKVPVPLSLGTNMWASEGHSVYKLTSVTNRK